MNRKCESSWYWMKTEELRGARVIVLGLGLHGGGAETARYLHRQGAELTITDLKPEVDLKPALDNLSGVPFHGVFGTHEGVDVAGADLVVKNPAVPRNASILRSAKRIATDISLFLDRFPGPLFGITGTKGKSTVVSALHYALRNADDPTLSDARLGGNITVSPLQFVDELPADRDLCPPVILELSSFQLGDLRLTDRYLPGGAVALSPNIAAITNILADHQNYYRGDFAAYVEDKELLFLNQERTAHTILNRDDEWGPMFAARTPATPRFVTTHRLNHGEWGIELKQQAMTVLLPDRPALKLDLSWPHGVYSFNLAVALLAATIAGMPPERVTEALENYPGMPHRMETVEEVDGVSFVNDSAATIPEATLAAVESIRGNVILIAGGTDKQLDLALFAVIAERVKGLVLLAGSATERIVADLEEADLDTVLDGPYRDVEHAVNAARAQADSGDTVLLSPGCASFELFANEFVRGEAFCSAVRALTS